MYAYAFNAQFSFFFVQSCLCFQDISLLGNVVKSCKPKSIFQYWNWNYQRIDIFHNFCESFCSAYCLLQAKMCKGEVSMGLGARGSITLCSPSCQSNHFWVIFLSDAKMLKNVSYNLWHLVSRICISFYVHFLSDPYLAWFWSNSILSLHQLALTLLFLPQFFYHIFSACLTDTETKMSSVAKKLLSDTRIVFVVSNCEFWPSLSMQFIILQ